MHRRNGYGKTKSKREEKGCVWDQKTDHHMFYRADPMRCAGRSIFLSEGAEWYAGKIYGVNSADVKCDRGVY